MLNARVDDLKVGDKVRCRRTGEVGVIAGFIEMPEGLPPAILVETDPETKKGVVREPTALEKIDPS